MKKLSREQLKNVAGGRAFVTATCSVLCGEVWKSQTCDFACNTTTTGSIECSGADGKVISTYTPCTSAM